MGDAAGNQWVLPHNPNGYPRPQRSVARQLNGSLQPEDAQNHPPQPESRQTHHTATTAFLTGGSQSVEEADMLRPISQLSNEEAFNSMLTEMTQEQQQAVTVLGKDALNDMIKMWQNGQRDMNLDSAQMQNRPQNQDLGRNPVQTSTMQQQQEQITQQQKATTIIQLTPEQIAELTPKQHARYNQLKAQMNREPENLAELRALEQEEQKLFALKIMPDIPMSPDEYSETSDKLARIVVDLGKISRSLGKWFAITRDDQRAKLFFKARLRIVQQFADGESMCILKNTLSIRISEIDQVRMLLESIATDHAASVIGRNMMKHSAQGTPQNQRAQQQPPPQSSQASNILNQQQQAARSPHQCQFCERSYIRLGNLKRHINMVHHLTRDTSQPSHPRDSFPEDTSNTSRPMESMTGSVKRHRALTPSEALVEGIPYASSPEPHSRIECSPRLGMASFEYPKDPGAPKSPAVDSEAESHTLLCHLCGYRPENNNESHLKNHMETHMAKPEPTRSTQITPQEPASKFDDIPFTDSGYASVAHVKSLPRNNDNPHNQIDNRQDESQMNTNIPQLDAQTSYSAASSIGPARTSDYISELCKAMHDRLRDVIDYDDLSVVKDALPDLLKAFALRLCRTNQAQSNRDIMYFIHRQHKAIIKHLEDTFQCDDNAPSTPRVADPDQMSIFDKMKLWNNMDTNTDDRNEEERDLFVGVLDDEADVVPESIELASYCKVVLQSKAYEWLIHTLQRECNMQRLGLKPSVMVDGIRRKILARLHSGVISKHRPPLEHCVTFVLDWRPIAERIQYENAGWYPGNTQKHILEFVTVTRVGDEAQAITVEGYFRQTWDSESLALVANIEQIINRDMNRYDFISTGDTRLSVAIVSDSIVITARGLAYSIALCGEQVAWLAAAVRLPRNSQTTIVQPSLTDLTNQPGDFPFNGESPTHMDDGLGETRKAPSHRQDLRFLVQTTEEAEDDTCQQAWQPLLGHSISPVIVSGFPVLNLPPKTEGLQTSWVTLLEAIGGKSATIMESTIRLEGSKAALELRHWNDDLFCWNVLAKAEELCLPDKTSKEGIRGQMGCASVTESHLANSRHIIYSKLERAESTPVYDNGTGDEPMGETQNLSPSSTTSFETGILSLSSRSNSVEWPVYRNGSVELFMSVLRRMIVAFHDKQSNSQSTSSRSDAPPPASDQPRQTGQKRKFQGDDDDFPDDGHDGNARKPKKPRITASVSQKRTVFLACPFWKLNPRKHTRCLRLRITTISYLKQHILRKHTPACYCQTCYATFNDEGALDDHLLQRSCTRITSASLDGVSVRQSRELHKKSKGGAVEQQWFAIWNILFRDTPRPHSIYVDLEQSDDYCQFREFSFRHGVAIFREELRSRGILRDDASDDSIHEAIQRCLDVTYSRFSQEQKAVSRSESSQSSTDPNRPRGEGEPQLATLGEGSTDSGVGTSMLYSSAQSHEHREPPTWPVGYASSTMGILGDPLDMLTHGESSQAASMTYGEVPFGTDDFWTGRASLGTDTHGTSFVVDGQATSVAYDVPILDPLAMDALENESDALMRILSHHNHPNDFL